MGVFDTDINYTNINNTNRLSQIFEADIYGGWITSLTCSVLEGGQYTGICNLIDSTQQSVTYNVNARSTGNGENCLLTIEFEGVDILPGGSGDVLNWNVIGFGSGYRDGFIYTTTTTGSGSGFSATLYVDPKTRNVTQVNNVNNSGTGYKIGDQIYFLNENGEQMGVPFKIQVTGVGSGGTPTYTSYAIKKVTAPDPSQDETVFNIPGFLYYHVDEQLEVSGSSIGEDDGMSFKCTVTDVAYGTNFRYTIGRAPQPLQTKANFQVVYDKFDKKHLVRIVNDNLPDELSKYGKLEQSIQFHDFDGLDYTPTTLPNQSTFVGYEIIGTKVFFEWSNDLDSKIPVSVGSTELTVLDYYIQSGKLVVELTEIPYGISYTFSITAFDELGKRIKGDFLVYNVDPDAVQEDRPLTQNYANWTESPYLLDEYYSVTLVSAADLMGAISADNYISQVGFPFITATGGGDVLTDNDVANNFVLAAKIIETNQTSINQSVINEYIVNNDLSILDKNSAVSGQVRMTGGQRYVYFDVDPVVYQGGDLLVFYWLNGNTTSGGWNIGYKESNSGGLRELRNFNGTNNWTGTQSPAGETFMVSLAFTRLVSPEQQ